MKKNETVLSALGSLSILVGGLMYLAYGWLPHQDYLPASLALTAVSGVLVYMLLVRVIRV